MGAANAKALPSVSNPYSRSSVATLFQLRIENKMGRTVLG